MYQAWEQRRAEYLSLIDGLRSIQAGAQVQPELPIPVPARSDQPAPRIGTVLDGLTYPQAVLECLRQVGRPMKASEVASRLHHLGFKGVTDRKRLKNSVDSAFRLLRIDGRIVKHPLGYLPAGGTESTETTRP